MDQDLVGKVVIVTGGTRGIGAEIARRYLEAGAHVLVCGRTVRGELPTCSQRTAEFVQADVRQPDQAAAVVDFAVDRFGRLDILVNNAALVSPGDLYTLSDADWGKSFDKKLNGFARCMRHAIPPMRGRKWGRIVNVTGGAGREPQPRAVATGMNNAAILNLTRAMANDLARDGILLTAVSPAGTLTERVEARMRKDAADSGKSEADVLRERGAKLPLGRLATPRRSPA
jgi:3-oxoacyl-[acyl-carrier protein] reductase